MEVNTQIESNVMSSDVLGLINGESREILWKEQTYAKGKRLTDILLDFAHMML